MGMEPDAGAVTRRRFRHALAASRAARSITKISGSAISRPARRPPRSDRGAIDAPRFHHQWLPDEVDVEPLALSPDTKQMLIEMGYKVVEQPTWGAAEGIVVMPEGASLADEPPKGVADSGALTRMKPGFL